MCMGKSSGKFSRKARYAASGEHCYNNFSACLADTLLSTVMMHSRFVAPLLGCLLLASGVLAQPAKKIDYAKDVQPIFAANCYKCHGEKRSESSFRIDRKADALKGGDIGKAIVPGKSNESPLIHYVSGSDKLKMPPKGDRLTA